MQQLMTKEPLLLWGTRPRSVEVQGPFTLREVRQASRTSNWSFESIWTSLIWEGQSIQKNCLKY